MALYLLSISYAIREYVFGAYPLQLLLGGKLTCHDSGQWGPAVWCFTQPLPATNYYTFAFSSTAFACIECENRPQKRLNRGIRRASLTVPAAGMYFAGGEKLCVKYRWNLVDQCPISSVLCLGRSQLTCLAGVSKYCISIGYINRHITARNN